MCRQLVRKWGVPLATAAGAPLLMPAVRAESGSDGPKEPPPAPPTSRMVRPSDLPIYEEPEEVLDFEYYGRERSSLEEGVGVVRKEVEGIMEATRSARERIVHIYETGKAHSMATIDYLTDEENMLPRAGAITVGGLAGLVIGARRRGGFIKKAMYTSTGVLTAASLCYPRQAYAVSQQVFGAAKNYGAIGYNFVVGVKPQSKTSPPEEPKEPEKEAETSATSPATEDTPPAPAPTPQPEGAEVRSAVALSLPPGKSLVDTLAEQASDVTVWGFRLTDQEGTASSRATTQDAPPKVPEGFGSISTADTVGESAKVVMGELKGESEDDAPVSQATEEEKKPMDTPVEGEGGSLVEKVVEALKEGTTAVEEKVTVVEERVEEIVEEGVIAVAKKVAVVEEKASTAVVEVLTPMIGEKEAEEVVEKVETVVEEAAEKVADLVEEKVAVVVEVAAKEVKEEAAVVEEVMQEVKETGEKVEKALDVAERVTKTVEKAAETYPVIPVAEVEKVEKVVKETEAVVENITEAAKKVEGLAEEVKKEAEKVEKEVTEVMESEEKRKEVLEEVLESVEAKEKQDISAVVEEPADVAPPQLKEAPQEDQKEVDTSPVAHLTPAVPQEREGLFDKLVNFFSKQDKDAIKSPKEEQLSIKATETRETPRDNKSTEISKELEHVKQVEVEAQSHIEGDTHTTQLPDSEGGTGSVHVGEGGSLVEEVVEVVKEEAAVAGEKVTEVKERMLETVKEGVIAVGEEVGVVEEKVSTAAVEVLTPMLGEKEATEVVGKVEMVVGEAVEKVAEMVEGKVAVVVEEAAKEVEEEAAVVKQLVEVVEETGEKVEKALNLVERVTGAVEEAAEKFPAVHMGEIEKVEEVVEGTEVAVESFTEAAKEVEELTEDVRKEAEKVEKVATEVMESEEKRKEVLEEVLESIEAKEKLDTGAVVEEPADVLPSQQDQKEVGTSVAHFTPSLPQEREGLFDKLVSFFSKQDKDAIESLTETAKEVELTEEVRKEAVKVEEEATEVMESKEKREEVLKEVLESLEIKEKQDTGTVVEDLALVPPPQPEKALQETEVDTPLVTPLTPAISQEREGLFDKLVNFFSKPDKDDIGSTNEYQAEKEVFQSTKEEQIEASVSEVKSDSEHRESITESTGRSESNTTQTIELEGIEKSESETVEKAEIGTTVKHESGIGGEMKEGKMQELVEEKEQIGKVEGEKEQVVEEETGWVMVEMKEEKGKVEETADEKVQSATSDEQYSREVGEIKEEAHGSGVVPTGKEGLFHQLVKLFTKDEAKPLSISDVVVPQESTLGSNAEGAPLLGEGEGKEPSISTLVKEDEVLPVAHGDVLVQENVPVTTSEDTVNVPDVSIVPENTVHAPDVSQLVEDKTLIIDTLTGSDDTAQIPSLPTVPDNIGHIADAGQALKDTAQVSKDTAECSDVSAAEPDIVEIVSSKLPQPAQTLEGVVVSTEQVDSEAVREPAGTLGTKKWVTEGTSVHPIEESTPPSPPPPVEKKSIFDKLASLFQEKQQEQLQETATEKVKKPLTEAEEPAVEVKKDMPGGTEQETSSFTKESEAAAMVLENPQEESSSVAPTEDVHPEPMSQPAMKDSTPTGSVVPETHVSSMGRKEEEEAALAAEAEAAPQQLQVSSPQSEAEVVQEGKDVIVKLEPTAPEKDYGQSNPDDSDMYTTRG